MKKNKMFCMTCHFTTNCGEKDIFTTFLALQSFSTLTTVLRNYALRNRMLYKVFILDHIYNIFVVVFWYTNNKISNGCVSVVALYS